MNRIPITQEGRNKLEKELEHLTKVHLPKNIKDIEEARAHGDISENAEFHAAKETQALIQAQISDLRSKLASCEIIDPASTPKDRVVFGARVQAGSASRLRTASRKRRRAGCRGGARSKWRCALMSILQESAACTRGSGRRG